MKILIVAGLTLLLALQVTSDKFDNGQSLKQATFEERRLRYDEESKEVASFLNFKNIFKTVLKLLFGSDEESRSTSRQVLSVFVKAIDMLKASFAQRSRSSGSSNFREMVDNGAISGLSMLKGYIKSIISENNSCTQRNLCESSREAIKEGREIGHIVAQLGGYASSYLLQHQKSTPFNQSYEAARRGRSGEDCSKIYLNCNETG